MKRWQRAFGASLVWVGAVFGVAACETPHTNMAEGRLFATGETRYDAFFKDVHTQQAAFPFWSDDKRATRKFLTTELDLLVDVDERVLASATRERARTSGYFLDEANPNDLRVLALSGTKGDLAFAKSVEEALRGERVRSRKLRVAESGLAELEKVGRELLGRVSEDFAKKGIDKAREVRAELNASLAAVGKLKADVSRFAQEADECAALLAEAVQGKGVDKKLPKRTPSPATSAPKREPRPSPPSAGTSSPRAAPSSSPPKPREESKASGEVFSP